MVSNNRLKCIKSGRNMMFPSHTLYANDVMLFAKGCSSSLEAIADLFQRYTVCSGQVCNPTKSILFTGWMTSVRHGFLANTIDFKTGYLTFIYLGVPLFKGIPKASYFQSVADKIRIKLADWKASLLPIVGRVNWLIQSFTTCCFIH